MNPARVTITVAAVALITSVPVAAVADIDLDDPNLLGPGEGWARPLELSRGDSGPWVMRMQERLLSVGFRPGPLDGAFDEATLGAVYAFQKVQGLERDGIFHTEDWEALEAAGSPELPEVPGQPDRVEIDLDAQVLYLVIENEVEAVLPISSGNGAAYRGRTGRFVRANTPEGSYDFYRHINGWRISYLGGLYRPFYFRGGYAIHGSTFVPPYPDSHGCVRVELWDMDYLVTKLDIGMPVHIYGLNTDRADLFQT
jgi:N-acetylmuramoyl-L-alanine amidase